MLGRYKKVLGLFLVSGLAVMLLHTWSHSTSSEIDIQPRLGRPPNELLQKVLPGSNSDDRDDGYHIKEDVAGRLGRNTCLCMADKETFHLPLSDWFFPPVWAHYVDLTFLKSHPDPEGVKSRRTQEYNSFQSRSYSPADMLIVLEANSPLQYPTQGVEVRPLKTIIIPGLGLKGATASKYMVKLTATLGTFDVAATVDNVSIEGEGEKHMVLSSAVLSALNRQLQFVTYTNTVFHPKTADTDISLFKYTRKPFQRYQVSVELDDELILN